MHPETDLSRLFASVCGLRFHVSCEGCGHMPNACFDVCFTRRFGPIWVHSILYTTAVQVWCWFKPAIYWCSEYRWAVGESRETSYGEEKVPMLKITYRSKKATPPDFVLSFFSSLMMNFMSAPFLYPQHAAWRQHASFPESSLLPISGKITIFNDFQSFSESFFIVFFLTPYLLSVFCCFSINNVQKLYSRHFCLLLFFICCNFISIFRLLIAMWRHNVRLVNIFNIIVLIYIWISMVNYLKVAIIMSEGLRVMCNKTGQ